MMEEFVRLIACVFVLPALILSIFAAFLGLRWPVSLYLHLVLVLSREAEKGAREKDSGEDGAGLPVSIGF